MSLEQEAAAGARALKRGAPVAAFVEALDLPTLTAIVCGMLEAERQTGESGPHAEGRRLATVRAVCSGLTDEALAAVAEQARIMLRERMGRGRSDAAMARHERDRVAVMVGRDIVRNDPIVVGGLRVIGETGASTEECLAATVRSLSLALQGAVDAHVRSAAVRSTVAARGDDPRILAVFGPPPWARPGHTQDKEADRGP